MAITNITQSLNLTSKTDYYLNRPSEAGMSSGYWFYYTASAANSTIPGKIVPYRWGTPLTTVEGTTLTLEGTIPLASESLNRRRIFHGSTITRIGPGINDITLAEEEDAFYFYHIGAESANDTPGYWDRAFKSAVGGGAWDYYQYHQHSPNVYADFDNARVAQAGYTYINVSDKRFGYLQPIEVKSGANFYLNVLARIHQPSVGGAHNSHNDIELGSSPTTNYMIGGIIPGTNDKFHAFYISPTSSQWYVYSRTYVLANGSFTSEINHGAYNLAAPTYSAVTERYEKPPIRASAGALMGSRVYVPIVYNSATANKFDVKIWSFPSDNSVSTGEISVTTILTASNFQPDCHLAAANGELNALAVDINLGCIGYYKLSGSSWINQGDLVTNGTQEVLRIHGFEYNPQDTLFYALISGDITGSVGNYSGSGVYSFSDGTLFTGYDHLSYITSSYGFQLKGPLETGHLRYVNFNGSLLFNTGSEPQAFDESYEVLQYDLASPKFFENQETTIGGKEYFYSGIKLLDGRVVLVGNIEDNPGNRGGADLFMALYPGDSGDIEYYAAGTDGIDYFTGVVEDMQRKCLWMTGYTRGYLVPLRDLRVHAFGRALVDATSFLEWTDLAIDTTGSQYVVGRHTDRDSIIAAKYDPNLELVWQRDISHNAFVSQSAFGVALDSQNNTYIAGKSNNKALVVKLDTTGSTLFSNTYTENGGEYASSIANINNYSIVSIVSGSSTILTVLDTTGSIIEQNRLSNFVVNKVKKSESEPGFFLLAGNDSGSPKKAKFAKGQLLSPGDMIKWVYTYSSGSVDSDAFDIKNTEESLGSSLGSGLGPKYHVVGKDGINGFITKFVVDEFEETYQANKLWGKTLVSSSIVGVTSTLYNTNPSSSISTYIVGFSSGSPEGEGMDDAILAKFDYDGNRVWTNSVGHMGDDRLVSIANDVTERNLYTAGWSESHTNGRRTFLFRSDMGGFGTGNYHLEESPGLEIQYKSSSLAVSNNNGTLSNVTPPTNIVISLTKTAVSYDNVDLQYSEEIYDGGVSYDMFIAKFNIESFQTHKNDPNHAINNRDCNSGPEYLDEYFSFWQVGTSGDGTADDGNFFGYDLLLMTGSNKIFVAGQTSGDIGAYNGSTVSGVYDYCLAVFDPDVEEFEFYQSGSNEDEEIYACAELSDGSGSIAFVGRSIGNFAGPTNGGYDLFLGIYNPITDERRYFNTGSVLNDRGVNVHDLGNNELAIVYETADAITGEINSVGGFDIGVIKFNYSSSLWATSSFQAGSSEDEFLSQDGKPSVLLPDGRIVVTGRTLGPFADSGQSTGGSDMLLAILDLEEGTYKKYQTGTAGNENGTTVFYLGGGLVGIAGYTDASFQQPENAIYTKFDLSLAPKARTLPNS